MEAKREAIIKEYLKGKSRQVILSNLKSMEFNPLLIKQTIKMYKETQYIQERPGSGRPRSNRTPGVVMTVKSKIARNHNRNLTEMAENFNMGPITMRYHIRDEFGIFLYKLKRQQDQTSKVKAKRFERRNVILQKLRTVTAPTLCSVTRRFFIMEQAFNPQNDSILAKKDELGGHGANWVQKTQFVIVYAAMTETGKPHLVFVPARVNINTKAYISTILEEGLVPWAKLQFQN
ncbi:uncharacterized protein [Lepeophtheirus salmonis]|uniref:uncharacterized protein n=1 Tax=Lepeophtheirus salmonis TaxID=72036 RepID=UPI003AF3AFA9